MGVFVYQVIVHGFLPMGGFAELPVFPSIQIYIGLLKDNKDNISITT